MANTRSSSRPQSSPSRGSPSPTDLKLTPSSSSLSSTTTSSGNKSATARFAHAPTRLTLGWLAVSLPLVIWDTVYTLGRPHTMPGGWLHEPLYTPYKLYGEVDHVYGWKAYNAGNGFTSAQGLLNAIETAMYLYYVYVWYTAGAPGAAGAANGGSHVKVGEKGAVAGASVEEGQRMLSGRAGALALLVAFGAAVMTLSKTVLYWANEYYSGFDNIGHNSLQDLIFLWIIPNGAWLVFPTYMIFSLGGDLIDGLAGLE